jgi:anaerobic selenocysteine-containing dehydrogenase
MSRRGFVKAAAVTAAAAALVSGSTKPLQALAEGEDPTAGEVKRIRSCCRACGKVECGVWVTVEDGKVTKVEGDESTSHGRGHCCSKSASSMQAAYHPDRLRYVMKRTNPKGDDDPGWVRITLEEGFKLMGERFGEIVDKYGGESIFAMGGTSRVWTQAPYGTLKQVFGTPNAHLAYEICKGPRHFGGILTDEIGSPWMEVEAEPKVYVQWGTAPEYSNYDSNNRTVTDVSQHSTCHILVDPRLTPLGKESSIWLPLRVGTDLCLSLSWLKWILDNEAYDDAFVRRWTNAPFLWCEDKEKEGEPGDGTWFMEMNGGIHMRTRLLTEADLKEDGSPRRFMVWDEANGRLTYWDAEECQWEGEEHRIPTTGMWVEHPYKPLVADAWLPDISTFADPATEPDRFPEGSDECNPEGLPKLPALFPGEVEVTWKDGTTHVARTVWDAFAENLEPYTLEYAEEVTEVPADLIEQAVRTYTTRVDPRMGNGGIHYQLAPDQTGHAVQNTRALQLIACITGNSDEPAGNRGSSKAEVDGCPGRATMLSTDYGDEAITWEGRDKSIEDQIPEIQDFVQYLLDNDSPLAERYGNKVPTDEEAYYIAERKGGAYRPSTAWPNPKTTWERNSKQISAERFPLLRYWNRWADAATIWDSINEIDTPYQIHGGVCMSGDFMNESNLTEAWEALTKLDFWVDINLWSCPNNGCADIVFPCLHWLEVNTTRVSQGAGGLFGAGQRAKMPEGDQIFDPVFVVLLYQAMGVPFNNTDDAYDEWLNLDVTQFVQMGGDVTYEEQEARVLKAACDAWHTEEFPEGPTFAEYAEKFQNEGWFDCRTYHPERWGTYRRWEMGYRRQEGGYNLYPAVDEKCAFMTPTGKVEVWSTIMESYIDDEDKFPHWVEPQNSRYSNPEFYDAALVDQIGENQRPAGKMDELDHMINKEGYKASLVANPDAAFIMTTGARQPVYFHTEHRQLPWCRELWPYPRVEMNPADCDRLGLVGGEWVWIETPWGKVREVLDPYYGIKEGTINANHGWWYPEVDTASHGFELVNINCVIDKYAQCWICGASQFRGVPALVYKATEENSPFGNPVPCDPDGNPVIWEASDPRLKEWLTSNPEAAGTAYYNANAKGLQTSKSLIKE